MICGGLDSTSLGFFLTETGKTRHTVFLSPMNVLNNDQEWSQRAAKETGSNHIVHHYGAMMPMPIGSDSSSVAHLPEGPSMTSGCAACRR
jgi:hypothetical protein